MPRKKPPKRRAYDTDLSDGQWALIEPMIPQAEPGGRGPDDQPQRLGRSRPVFNFATSRAGERLRADNPVQGVKLDVPHEKKKRERRFRDEEVRAILSLARGVEIRGRYPRVSASRRWAPWICAYLGCRIQGVCWLKKEDFAVEAGVAVVDFRQTKTGDARRVPLHDALIEEGLLDFVEGAPLGYLFVETRRGTAAATRTMQEQRASQVVE